ncbi:MAG: hypothetical protein VX130_03390 [Verrucomicrobiota bacterium]|nr:hypothetical protein [Verrucomicrobiota bacterium]
MAQESSGDGETAAEAAVTGSATNVADSTSGSIEGNPLVIAVRSGTISLNDALRLGLAKIREIASAGGDFDKLLKAYNDAGGEVDFDLLNALQSLNLDDDVLKAALVVGGMDSYNSNYQTALVEAAKVAATLLQDRTISKTADIPATIGIDTLTSSGYNVALLELLNAYGAIGSKGSSLLDNVIGASRSLDDSISALGSTSDYLSFLSTLTGSRTFGEIDSESTVLSVSTSNIQLAPGATVTLGSSEAASTISVESKLGKAIDYSDRKILIVGAAKDLTVAGDVTLTNSNDVEDHALVLGAADELKVDGKDITYTGSNLAIAAGGETTHADAHIGDGDEADLYLHNTVISTGGNLAAGTLGSLSISTADFIVGTANSLTSDPDNVYLYANDLIQINGLGFSGGHLDDVYMEAITINLNNVHFPASSEVHLRSRDGTLSFDTFSTPVVGAVNLTKVSHGAINGENALTIDNFIKTSNGFKDNTEALATGKKAFTISSQLR